MHKFIEEIKELEQKPYVIKKFIDNKELEAFQNLYKKLPIEINNQRQKIIKKKWSINFFPDLQKIFITKLKSQIGEFKMDNLITEDGKECFGLFQESINPLKLHVDAGFNLNDLIYKQTLMPLSDDGETIIFKNRFYGCSTTFSINPAELSAKGYNKRSSEHINLYNKKSFSKDMHKKFLRHEDIENLKGLEIDMIYKWKLGDMLIFDRTNLHCSSSNLEKNKIGFTTSTAKK